jgi:hypothetical protein
MQHSGHGGWPPLDHQFSAHALVVLRERAIEPGWVEAAVSTPDQRISQSDGTVHYLKRIDAFAGRWLRVVVNPAPNPPIVVTLFFDRRLP